MGRIDIRIDITNANTEEAEEALSEALRSIASHTTTAASGEHWAWKATRRDEDETSGFGCHPQAIPTWVREGWDTGGGHEHVIDGQRYLRTNHVILAVRGRPSTESARGGAQSLMAVVQLGIESGMRLALTPLTGEPTTPGRVYLPEDNSGAEAYDYRVNIGHHPQAFAARYVALVEMLCPGVRWLVGAVQYAQAVDVEGRVVAVLMETKDQAEDF